MCCGTDWPTLLVFTAAVGAMIALWAYSFYHGQVNIALNGMNWMGNVCNENGAGYYQAWINPSVTTSYYATAVCMPSCPTVTTTTPVYNDSATIAALQSAASTITDPNAHTEAEDAIAIVQERIGDLNNEVEYLEAQVGTTQDELDASAMYCLCNLDKFAATYATVSETVVNMTALCSAYPANVNGYVELPYSSNLATFVGYGQTYSQETMDLVPCAFRYRTQPTLNRCMPWVSSNALGRVTLVTGTAGISDAISGTINTVTQHVVDWAEDMDQGKYIVMICLSCALVSSILLIYLLACNCGKDADGVPTCQLVSCLIWGTLILLAFMLVGTTFVCSYQFKHYYDLCEITPALASYSEDEVAMYVYGVSMCVAGIATLVHIICLCPCVCGNEIENSIQIIYAAAEVFEDSPALLLYPLWHNLALFIAVICWLIGLIFISTSGDLVTMADGVHTLEYSEEMQYSLIYYILMIIWIVEFMGAVGFMVICGAVLIAFFDHHICFEDGTESVEEKQIKEDTKNKRAPLLHSLGLVLWNHLGTAAFGSLLISIVVIVRWTVTAITQYIAQKDGSAVAKFLAACVASCCACFEKCMRYMVRTAYIVTVLDGTWFCGSVCGGMKLVFDNLQQFSMTNYIAWTLIWLCKLAVPAGYTVAAFFMIESGWFGCSEDSLSSTFNVLVPIALVSCVFSFTFMGLLNTSIEVVLVAYCKLGDDSFKERFPDAENRIPLNFKKAEPFIRAARQAADEKRAAAEKAESLEKNDESAPLMADAA